MKTYKTADAYLVTFMVKHDVSPISMTPEEIDGNVVWTFDTDNRDTLFSRLLQEYKRDKQSKRRR